MLRISLFYIAWFFTYYPSSLHTFLLATGVRHTGMVGTLFRELVVFLGRGDLGKDSYPCCSPP